VKKTKFKPLDFKGEFSDQFDFIDGRYKFRFNLATHELEFIRIDRKMYSIGDWEPLKDRTLKDIKKDLGSEGMKLSVANIKDHIESSYISEDYDPFNEYFASLEPWGGHVDYIKQLADTVTVNKSDQDLFYEMFKRFLIATVDCLLNDSKANDVCLVFQGRQGIGKSRWMRSLMPKEFKSKYFYEGEIQTSNKDHEEYLSAFWFIHLDELESVSSNKIGSLKSFITRQYIQHRKAFGIYRSKFIRRASFLGSVNNDTFLTDTTGNRRWLVFKAKELNYNHNLDIDNVWSQAHSLLLSGERYWLSQEEIESMNERNERFRNQSKEEEMMLDNFEMLEDGQSNGEWMSATDMIGRMIDFNPKLAIGLRNGVLGKAASKYEKKSKTIKGSKKYFVRYIGRTEVPQDDDNLPF